MPQTQTTTELRKVKPLKIKEEKKIQKKNPEEKIQKKNKK